MATIVTVYAVGALIVFVTIMDIQSQDREGTVRLRYGTKILAALCWPIMLAYDLLFG